jgi:transcription initiation factor TFIIF subunit alpha
LALAVNLGAYQLLSKYCPLLHEFISSRDQREEARRKKLGIVSRKYKPDSQPWLLKVGGKTGKKYKGIRDGGISDNAAYYIFTHAADGHIDAYPLHEWLALY